MYRIFYLLLLSLSFAGYSSSYVELCQSKTLPKKTKNTFRALIKASGTTSCQESFDAISKSQVITLKSEGIQDFSPLRFFPELKELYVSEGLGSKSGCGRLQAQRPKGIDLSPLANLKNLKKLRLRNLGINNNDLIPLAGLTNLGNLDLACNDITEITALAHLKGLFALDLGYNQVSDISSLAQLKDLMDLSLRANRMSDSSGFNALSRLMYLDVAYNRLTHLPDMPYLNMLIGPFNLFDDKSFTPGSFPNLAQVLLGWNKFTKVPDIGAQGSMLFFYINNNRITSLDGIENFTGVTGLGVSNNPLSDEEIAKIDGSNLTTQGINATGITKLPDFSRYESLQIVHAEDNEILAVTDDQLPTYASRLFLARNRIESFQLQNKSLNGVIDVSENQLREVTINCSDSGTTVINVSDNFLKDDGLKLKNCQNSKNLMLSNTHITDIGFLAEYSLLRGLDISQNPIKDISSLKNLELLKKVDFSDIALGTSVRKTATNCPKDALSPAVSEWCAKAQPTLP